MDKLEAELNRQQEADLWREEWEIYQYWNETYWEEAS